MEVVPDVNCMLIMSSTCRGESGMTACWLVEFMRSLNGTVACRAETSIRFDELSTRNTFRRERTALDCSKEASRSGVISLSRDMFSLGGLKGRFVSAPIIRCEASRWLSAEMTCGELKAGFSGTCSRSVHFYILPVKDRRTHGPE